jgi:hypothetical protein
LRRRGVNLIRCLVFVTCYAFKVVVALMLFENWFWVWLS